MITLFEVFEEAFKNVKIDSKLCEAIYKFQVWYATKNEDHLNFFGGNLLGVQVIRFKDSDLAKFYDEVLRIDYFDLSEQVRKVTTINHTFKVSSDVFNLTCMYLIHRFLTEAKLPETKRINAAKDCGLLFFYRCVAAILSAWFRYPTDPAIAQAAYARLSNKFLIKKLGSWDKVMLYRTNELINKNNIHYNALVKFNDDSKIVYCINDSQGRIKDLLKNYMIEFKKVHSQGESISSTSSTYLDAEGEETVKEKIKSVESNITYIKNILHDKHSFIKDDLISVICNINSNTSFRMLKHTLSWLSHEYNTTKHHNLIDEFVTKVVIHSFHLIEYNVTTSNLKDYPHLLISLKNLYLSTRSEDADLVSIRELGEKLIKLSSNKLSDSLMMSTRTAVILYITLRTLIGKNA